MKGLEKTDGAVERAQLFGSNHATQAHSGRQVQRMDDDEKMLRVKDAIRARLRRLCSHMSDSDFEELVEKIAYNETKSASAKPPWAL